MRKEKKENVIKQKAPLFFGTAAPLLILKFTPLSPICQAPPHQFSRSARNSHRPALVERVIRMCRKGASLSSLLSEPPKIHRAAAFRNTDLWEGVGPRNPAGRSRRETGGGKSCAWALCEKSQYAQTAVLFPPYCVDFPRNTQSIAASNRLVWRKNSSPLDTFPIFKQGLALPIFSLCHLTWGNFSFMIY